jgi:hypothetical protein
MSEPGTRGLEQQRPEDRNTSPAARPMKRMWVGIVAASYATAVVAAYAELVLDIRTPRSDLVKEIALGAGAHISLVEYNKKVEQLRAQYGKGRVQAPIELSTGQVTVALDGNEIQKWQIPRTFASMYGVVVVTPPGAAESIFPFNWEPGRLPTQHEPSIARLQALVGNRFPAKFLAFDDADWTRDRCVPQPTWSETRLGQLAGRLHVRWTETFCVVHWNGSRPRSMLIDVMLAEGGDPWIRPFVRWICRKITESALKRDASPDHEPPDYAACVLVDRPDRTGPTGAQDAFASVVYEIRGRTLARID